MSRKASQPVKVPIVCDRCGRQREVKPTRAGQPRLAGGWKRHADQVWCAKCFSDGFVLRAVTMPVAGPVDGTWDELRETLKTCWAQATRAANWAVSELYRTDVRRNGQAKLPAHPGIYLYPGARAAVPEMDPQSIVALLHAVEGKYRRGRFDLIWRQSISLPNYRYPAPYPVHNQSWRAEEGPDGEALINVRLGGRRWVLRLRGGHQYRRQRGAHRMLVKGEAIAGELAIYQVTAGKSDHRPEVRSREAGGGAQRRSRVMAKMVMWMPKRDRGEKSGALHLRTAADALWVYHLEGGEPRHLHADHVRRWAAEHRKRLDRMSDDTKREKRWPKANRRQMNEARQRWTLKHRRRLDSFTHEAAAMLAGYAQRQRVAQVIYDDSNRAYPESFPWSELETKLRYKLEERGIELAKRVREAEGAEEAAEAGAVLPTGRDRDE